MIKDIHAELARLTQVLNNLRDLTLGMQTMGHILEGHRIIDNFKKTFPKQMRKMYWDPDEPEIMYDSPEDYFYENPSMTEKFPTMEQDFLVAYEAVNETYVCTEDFSKERDDENRIQITFKEA